MQIKTLAKTLEILCSFNALNTHQRASDIAKNLNMNISTVLRHLSDLVNYGFLEQDYETTYYYLGKKVVNLAGVALSSNSLYNIAYSEMYYFNKKMNLHTNMSVLNGTDILYLIEFCTEKSFELLMPVGYTRPAAISAMGRMMLTDLPEKAARAIIKATNITKLTPYTLTNVDDIMNQIALAKKNGFCILTDEIHVGTTSVATAIREKNGKVVASVAVSVDSVKLNGHYKTELIDTLLHYANRVSSKLGYFIR